MSEYLYRLASTEAAFRTEVIDGLHREARRLRDHQVLLAELPAVRMCLEDLATALQDAADTLRSRDGLLEDAIDAEPVGGGARWRCAS